MKKIIPIPPRIVSRIAAGEVIERPVYAVKELVENAIDAHADSISIQIEESGLKKIIVTDDGEGMSEEDIVESFKPHTTSKLHEDLVGVKTLGFRGEALSSIAAVSDMTIQSRVHTEAAGVEVHLKTGKVEYIGPVGMPPGTTVTVNNLFYSVPARKKFLKSERTEFRKITDLISQYALSYPNLRFLLIHNKRIILDLPKNQSLNERLEKLLGSTVYAHLIPVANSDSHIQISGFIARPQIATRSNRNQFVFINNRITTDKVVTAATKEAYGNLLEPTQFPVFILFVALPYESVDVNVHPRKEMIAFVNAQVVFDEVKEIVRKTLEKHNLTFSNLSFTQYSPRAGTTTSVAGELLREAVEPWNIKNTAKILKSSDIQQIHNVYITAQTEQGMMLIDQHAAHERILYEQFLEAFQKKKKVQQSYTLKKPVIIDLPFSEAEEVVNYLRSFKNMGFDIDQFSQNSYRVNAVPELFRDRDIRLLILELLEQFAHDKKDGLDRISDMMISYLACRAAIKAGEKLTKDEAKKLIDKLEKTPNNATCPHGRPTKIEVKKEDLDRMFKRK